MTFPHMDVTVAAQAIVFAITAGFVGLRFVPPGNRQRLGIALLVAYIVAAAALVTWFATH